MKIGILTHFHKSTNYGGVLQAYALCKFLNNCGYDAEQILYVPKVKTVSASSHTVKNIYSKIFSRLGKRIYRKKNQAIKERMERLFCNFRDAVPHTQRVYTQADIADTNALFDTFITGSDQVWNPIWYEPAYLLSFVKDSAIKLSYAASIGIGKLDEEQSKLYTQFLPSFDAISVREKTAQDLLSPLLDIKVNVCVDPTLLLSVEEWDQLTAECKIHGKYVFLYLLGNDSKTRKTAVAFAEAKGLKLVTIPDLKGAYRASDRKMRAELIDDATPADYLSLIKYADFVITDSFHTCVFSLLYKKQFFAFQADNRLKMESRIQNLTKMFGCPERFCSNNENEADYLLQMQAIDYTSSISEFENEKQRSVEYLKSNLS